jgi:polysaccharide chain length determinant protein (PEP-CTERM system associated)
VEADALTPGDILQIINRRKWSLILPFCMIVIIAVLVAFLLPSVYRSSATLLIENQEIPAEFVTATVTSYAEQRIQRINQRIMSFDKLHEIIDKFNLYADQKDKWTTDEMIEKMKDDIQLVPVSAEIMDRKTGRPSTATIAFRISYNGKNPATVQRVANTLTSFFLKEDLRVRTRQTAEASSFFEEEANKLKTRLLEFDTKTAQFKKQHINELPEVFQVNLQGLNNLENSIDRANEQLRSLKEREGYLQTQLAAIPIKTEGVEDKRLEELKSQLIYLNNRYSDQYPDVVKTKAEIAELETIVNKTDNRVNGKKDAPKNPAYITLASQLASTRSEIQSVKNQIVTLNEQKQIYKQRIAATPGVEETYNQLMFERRSLQAKYDDLMQKFMETQVAHGLEEEQKGERFTLIEPARLPVKPVKPNRLAIVLIGFVLGIGAGVGLASLREFSDQSVRDARSLSAATGFPVLAGIPEIVTAGDRRRRRIRKILLIAGIIVSMVSAVLIFHYFVMDLYVFQAKLMRKLQF